MPRLEVRECPLEAILGMRDDYRRELGVQIVHDSWHQRGFTRSYLLLGDGLPVGYGAVGGAPGVTRDVVKEVFLQKPARASAPRYFQALVAESRARWIEAQTNDFFLYPLLEAFGHAPSSDTLLFADAGPTAHRVPGVHFRRLPESEHSRVFPHTGEPVGEWALERRGEVVATGGFMLHYNPPFADLYNGGCRPASGTGTRSPVGAGAQAGMPQGRARTRGAMPGVERGVAGDVDRGGDAAVRADRPRQARAGEIMGSSSIPVRWVTLLLVSQ